MKRLLLLFLFTITLISPNVAGEKTECQITHLRHKKYEPDGKKGSCQYCRFPFVRTEGHGGAGVMAPENSLEGFQLAIDIGLDSVECDVWLSKDNVVLVHHAPPGGMVNFTTGKFNMTEIDSDDLTHLTLANGQKMITLEELLDLAKDKISVNIEIEDTRDKIVGYIVDLVIKKDMLGQVFISSFYHYLRKTLTKEVAKRSLKTPISFGFITMLPDLVFPDYGTETFPGDSINIDARFFIDTQDKATDEMAKAAGFDVKTKYWFPWVCKTEKWHYDQMIDAGTNTILANEPLVLIDYLKIEEKECMR